MHPAIRPIPRTLLLCLFLAIPAVARAQWTTNGIQNFFAHIMSDGAMGVFATTDSYSQVARYGPGGTAYWVRGNGVCSTLPGYMQPDGSGGVVAMIGGGTEVKALRYAADGSDVWSATLAPARPANTFENLRAMASDGTGDCIGVWIDNRNGGLDLYAQRVRRDGSLAWSSAGLPLCTASNDQLEPAAVSDGARGAIVVWHDDRLEASGGDLFVQRLDSLGNALWTAGGKSLTTAAGIQQDPMIVADGSGGAIVAWMDARGSSNEIYAQRVDAAGTPLWSGDGIAITNAPFDQILPGLVADGAGGAWIAWQDARSAATGMDIYVQHVDASGASQLANGGVAVCTAASDQTAPFVCPDDGLGVFVGWGDARVSGQSGFYVQHVAANGAMLWVANGLAALTSASNTCANGMVRDGAGGVYVQSRGRLNRILFDGTLAASPTYATSPVIHDEPADQGGWAQLAFDSPKADYLQLLPGITYYSAWRRIGGSAVVAPAIDAPADITGPVPPGRRLSPAAASAVGFPPGSWEALGTYPALGLRDYVFLVPTHDDSTAAGPNDEAYVLVTQSTAPDRTVVSTVATGHSVDNLPPLPPQSLVARSLTATSAEIAWSPSGERDFSRYAVYRGSVPTFEPSLANRIATPLAATLTDDGYDPDGTVYKITALDRHGNESPPALLALGRIAGGTTDEHVAFVHPVTPDPVQDAGRLEYGLAAAGRVEIALYDLHGRRVRTLADGIQAAGRHVVRWSVGTGAEWRLDAGVYFLRVIAPGMDRRTRFVVLR